MALWKQTTGLDRINAWNRGCMVEYLGMRSYPPFVAYASPRIDEAGRKAYLSQWRERLLEITKDAVPAQ